MIHFKTIALFFSLFFLILNGFSQKKSSFGQIERQIETEIPKIRLDSSKGWKYKHRWLNEFKKRVDPNGNFYDETIFFKEAEQLAQNKLKNTSQMAGWIPVGPNSRADFSMTKGMGRINCIAFHPTDTATFWVGVAQGGVWKTTDGGDNWTPLTDDLPILRISHIAVDPSNPDIIYICVGDYAYIDVSLDLDDRKRHSHFGLGVYKTEDGGLSWSPTGLTYQLTQLDGSLMRSVLINPNYPDSLVAAGVGGIWTSSDAGANWTQKHDSLIWDMEVDPNDAYTIYATTGHLKQSQQGSAGIIKSTDFGNTWSTLNTGIPPTGFVQRVEIAIAPTNSNHLYALACDYQEGLYGVYTSINGGNNWNLAHSGFPNILEWYDGTSTGGQDTYDLTLLVDPTDENTVYTGGVNIWGSTDGASTFNPVSLWFDYFGLGVHADQHQFGYNPLDSMFYLCNDGGLVRTSQIEMGSWLAADTVPGYQFPTQWEYISDGMQTSSFYSVGISEGNSGNFSAGAQDNSTYFINNSNWSNLFGGDGMATMLHPTNANVIYGSSQYGRIMYSSNGGTGAVQMDGPSNEEGEWVTPFMFEPGNTEKVYAGFGNLYSSSPGNDFVVSLSNFATMPGASIPSPISCFNISESDSKTIYLAKRIYHSYNQPSEFWVTNDGGLSWINRTAGLPDDQYFTAIEVDDNDPLSVWVTVSGFEAGKHIYHTSNGGVTWQNQTFDLPNLPVNCIVHRDKSFYNTVYVGTDIGTYYSNDTSNFWLPYNANLPNVIVSDLKIHYTDEKIYAATFGRGVWQTDLLTDSLSLIDSTSTVDIKFNWQNVTLSLYPNPNNGIFNVDIEGLSGVVNVAIIDVMGRVISDKPLNIKEKTHHYTHNEALPNGLYFIKISKGNKSKTVRFMVQ